MSHKPIKTGLSVFAGQTVELDMAPVVDELDAVINIALATAKLSIRKGNQLGDSVLELTEATGIDVATDGANGVLTVNMTAVQSLQLQTDGFTTGSFTIELIVGGSTLRSHYGDAELFLTNVHA